jgi:hypothetical protein
LPEKKRRRAEMLQKQRQLQRLPLRLLEGGGLRKVAKHLAVVAGMLTRTMMVRVVVRVTLRAHSRTRSGLSTKKSA